MYKQCTNCVCDTTMKEIVFDENGRCNFCKQAEKSLEDNKKLVLPKFKGTLLGLSGGVDSSYVLHKMVEQGIYPICFSLDNGWNDPRADENIRKMVEKLGVLHTVLTIDKKIYSNLQSAFFHSGVPNIEIPTDHILMAMTYKLASDLGIKTILSGGNTATESIMPPSWGYNARDLTHIKDIYKKFTGKRLKGLPMCGLLKWNYYKWIKGIKIIYPLDFMSYNRAEAIKILQKEYGYEDYGDKHCESEFTKWFQNFYLYEKFGYDKRKPHYSSMIVSGQMTREEAIEKLKVSPEYPVLGIEQKVLSFPKHSHYEYKTDEWLFNLISKIIKWIR